MNKTKALEILFTKDLIANDDLKCLMVFENGMSRLEFSNACNKDIMWTYKFAYKYGLIFPSKVNAARVSYYKGLHEQYVPKWNKELTISGNAILLGISHAKARTISREFNLPCKYKTISDKLKRKIARMNELREKNLTDAEISRIMCHSREYIRQLRARK